MTILDHTGVAVCLLCNYVSRVLVNDPHNPGPAPLLSLDLSTVGCMGDQNLLVNDSNSVLSAGEGSVDCRPTTMSEFTRSVLVLRLRCKLIGRGMKSLIFKHFSLNRSIRLTRYKRCVKQ